VRRGHTIGYVECTITDEESRLVAKAASTCMVASRPEGIGPVIHSTLAACIQRSQITSQRVFGCPREFCGCPWLLVKNTSRRDCDRTVSSVIRSGMVGTSTMKRQVYRALARVQVGATKCVHVAVRGLRVRAFSSSCTNCSVCVMLRSSTGRRRPSSWQKSKRYPNLQALSSSPPPAQHPATSEAVLDALKMMLIGASSGRSSDQCHPSNRSPQ